MSEFQFSSVSVMVRYKNAGGGSGDDDRHRPTPHPAVDKGKVKVISKKRRRDRDTERALQVARAAEIAEQGGARATIRFGGLSFAPDTSADQSAAQAEGSQSED